MVKRILLWDGTMHEDLHEASQYLNSMKSLLINQLLYVLNNNAVSEELLSKSTTMDLYNRITSNEIDLQRVKECLLEWG